MWLLNGILFLSRHYSMQCKREIQSKRKTKEIVCWGLNRWLWSSNHVPLYSALCCVSNKYAAFISPTRVEWNFRYSWHAFKLLNGVFRAETFYVKVSLKHQINLFLKFIIIKTQLITRYYRLILFETLNFNHLQEIRVHVEIGDTRGSGRRRRESWCDCRVAFGIFSPGPAADRRN